ncbi:hypothetical protein SETIT_6G133600v2 [Setaria italica]|uniref:Uncharacterized protein n=2 Tax=Setaria TaxID=4554 RepID=A0A368RL30_SETIT|nr:hypothetical protein SETIT_6G133600v2 [Setaria italica]
MDMDVPFRTRVPAEVRTCPPAAPLLRLPSSRPPLSGDHPFGPLFSSGRKELPRRRQEVPFGGDLLYILASAVSPGRFAPRPPPLRDLASLPPPSDLQVISLNCLASGPARCTTMQLPISRALPQRRR